MTRDNVKIGKFDLIDIVLIAAWMLAVCVLKDGFAAPEDEELENDVEEY